jgi:hypothetical protein
MFQSTAPPPNTVGDARTHARTHAHARTRTHARTATSTPKTPRTGVSGVLLALTLRCRGHDHITHCSGHTRNILAAVGQTWQSRLFPRLLSLRSPISASAALAQTLQSVAVIVLTSHVVAIASLSQVLVRRGAVPPEVTEALVRARCVKLYQTVCTFIPLIFVCKIASGRGAHWLSFNTVPWGIG